MNQRVYVADFGSAFNGTLAGQTATQHRNPPVTNFYKAPEYAQAMPRSRAADMWSLGIIFLEITTALVGKRPSRFRTFLEQDARDHQRYSQPHANLAGLNKWMDKLRNDKANTEAYKSNEPLNWTTRLLQKKSEDRITAKALLRDILDSPFCKDYCCAECEANIRQLPCGSETGSQQAESDYRTEIATLLPCSDSPPVLSQERSLGIMSWMHSTLPDRGIDQVNAYASDGYSQYLSSAASIAPPWSSHTSTSGSTFSSASFRTAAELADPDTHTTRDSPVHHVAYSADSRSDDIIELILDSSGSEAAVESDDGFTTEGELDAEESTAVIELAALDEVEVFEEPPPTYEETLVESTISSPQYDDKTFRSIKDTPDVIDASLAIVPREPPLKTRFKPEKDTPEKDTPDMVNAPLAIAPPKPLLGTQLKPERDTPDMVNASPATAPRKPALKSRLKPEKDTPDLVDASSVAALQKPALKTRLKLEKDTPDAVNASSAIASQEASLKTRSMLTKKNVSYVNVEARHTGGSTHVPRDGAEINAAEYIKKAWANLENTKSIATSAITVKTSRTLRSLNMSMIDRSMNLLERCCREGKVAAVRYILDQGVKAENRPQALHSAIKGASARHVKCVAELIKHNANVNARTVQGISPLHVAIDNKFFDHYNMLIGMLLVAGAKVNSKDEKGQYPLLKILTRGGNETLQAFQLQACALFLNPDLPRTVNINAPQIGTKDTALHLAVRRRSPVAVALLVHGGADVNAKNGSGLTPLLMASNQWPKLPTSGKPVTVVLTVEQELILEYLLQSKEVDIDAVGGSLGRTVLHHAVSTGSVKAVGVLVKKGANTKAKDKNRDDASQIAHEIKDRMKPGDFDRMMRRLKSA